MMATRLGAGLQLLALRAMVFKLTIGMLVGLDEDATDLFLMSSMEGADEIMEMSLKSSKQSKECRALSKMVWQL